MAIPSPCGLRCGAALALVCGLSGCAGLVSKPYRGPELALPERWSGQALTGAAVADGKPWETWWHRFHDPVLDQLIERALRANNNLAAAAIKVRVARLTAGLTDTNLTPDLSVGASSEASRDLRRHTGSTTHSVTGTVSYQVDLWGKLASAREASRWEAEATEADRQSSALALIGTTATLYWQVAYLNQRIATSTASIAYAEKTLALVEVKWQAGAVSNLDRVQARQTLAAQRATLPDLVQQRAKARNALAILLGQLPGEGSGAGERQALPAVPDPEVAAGLPASLLARRPDLRAAEMRLREAWANVNVSKASFYPALSLTGSLGSSSTSLKDVLRNPVGTLGAGLTLPFLQWNTARLTVRISQATYEQSVATFRQTLLQALSDVETALSAREQDLAAVDQLQQSLDLARQAEALAEVRYRAGATGLQTWLDLQETRRSAETSLAENRLSQLDNLMILFQALGGDASQPVH